MNDKLQMFENRLQKVYKHRSKLARRQNITCWRVYDHDLPEFPFAIEFYADKIYLAEYLRRHGMEDDEHEQWLEDCLNIIAKILETDKEKIFIRQRRKMSHRESGAQYEKLNTESHFFNVEESGLKFRVNLTDYLDTGLFLDHRITRAMVRDESTNKRVLNLFCYTGSFSVYAASAGASSVVSVDLSKTYLGWAEDNFNINKQRDKKKYQFVHADVKQYLKTLKPESFDLVIMDPPTFSNSKRMKDILDIQIDHTELINDVMHALSAKGILYFSTNYTKFILDKENIKASEIKDITKATTPFDFEGKLKRWCFKIIK
ncbi:MAG: class I SAM-dependent methyltransferase [Arachidicoccus sp.]|nr:class I SAM-dependent methyltransferase [Arachidicoccus sp.]